MLALAVPGALAFDANDIKLGASEKDIKQRFPHANCRPLEWPSHAADRRCDDSRIQFAGVDARVTFYLRRNAVEGFDVRFHPRDWNHVASFLRARFGSPAAEAADKGRLEWRQKDERALLSTERDRRRA